MLTTRYILLPIESILVMNKRIIYSLVIIVIAISLSTLLPNFNPIQQPPLYAASPNTSDLKQDVKQNMNQDNLCNKPDECNQASEGQQIQGNDNSAAGFTDQSTTISPGNTTGSAPSTTTQVAQGQAGPQGIPGPAGPPRTAVVTERASTGTIILPGTIGFAEASCNPGEISTGGGYRFTPSGVGVTPPYVSGSKALTDISGNNLGWEIDAFNPGTSNTDIVAFAECLKLVP